MVQKTSPGDHSWKTFTVFFSILNNSRGNYGQAFSGSFASRLCHHYNHCPRARPAHVAKSGPRARLQVLQNSGGQMPMLRFKNPARWPPTKKKIMKSTAT